MTPMEEATNTLRGFFLGGLMGLGFWGVFFYALLG
jgi:hypothetical protein